MLLMYIENILTICFSPRTIGIGFCTSMVCHNVILEVSRRYSKGTARYACRLCSLHSRSASQPYKRDETYGPKGLEDNDLIPVDENLDTGPNG